MNTFSAAPVTHFHQFNHLYTTPNLPLRIRAQNSQLFILNINGTIELLDLNNQLITLLGVTKGQPIDIFKQLDTIYLADVHNNNLYTISSNQAQPELFLDKESTLNSPIALTSLNGYLYISDSTGVYAISGEKMMIKLFERRGIVALCTTQECVFAACVNDNSIYCIKPGFEPTWYSGGLIGVSKIVDMCAGPEGSLVCVCEGVAQNGLLWIISCHGVPTVCLGISGLPQSCCYCDDKIIISLSESKELLYVPVDAFV